jgi:hypothetical protein
VEEEFSALVAAGSASARRVAAEALVAVLSAVSRPRGHARVDVQGEILEELRGLRADIQVWSSLLCRG